MELLLGSWALGSCRCHLESKGDLQSHTVAEQTDSKQTLRKLVVWGLVKTCICQCKEGRSPVPCPRPRETPALVGEPLDFGGWMRAFCSTSQPLDIWNLALTIHLWLTWSTPGSIHPEVKSVVYWEDVYYSYCSVAKSCLTLL